ncbi:hypothetical protein KFL_004340150 [Klebsormidium nitens]|uniref:Uncharacterized protein n=1 Tax=Klebsormidium nitens TaxID=105231 RepID=A0A1Y1IK55_KLENI|nr:hypothetical protein KFL_004340150 [Klebsormidium nitens]|eukprot:GAQ88508.1 hypothetical protein KFL_004340150 [Klebsormidium nitens]
MQIPTYSIGVRCSAHKEAEGPSSVEQESKDKSGSITGFLVSQALKLYLKTQLDAEEDLQVLVFGRNRDLLSGTVRTLVVTAKNAVYKGVSVSEACLTASKVKVTLNGEKRGLKEPFVVEASLKLTEKDFQKSLASPLTRRAVLEALRPENFSRRAEANLDVRLEDGTIGLQQGSSQSRLGLQLNGSGNVLTLVDLDSRKARDVFLGDDTHLRKVEVSPNLLSCEASFLVTP